MKTHYFKKIFNLKFLVIFFSILFCILLILDLTFERRIKGIKKRTDEIIKKIKDDNHLVEEIVFYETNSTIFEKSFYRVEILVKNKNNLTTKEKWYAVVDSIFFHEIHSLIKGRENIQIKDPKTDFHLSELILSLVPIVSSTIFMFYIISNIKKSSGKLNSNAKVSAKQKSLFTFKDVAGNTEEKEEMTELIDFLKQPQKYETIGAAIPKGVLLEGPPGTGKTLLAKALAGEANVPFFAASGSEFVEMYVGVGASRVRTLFKEAKLNAPCVLFIDEIDVLGGKRGGNSSGGNQEKDQTLNQLLTEMDGFTQAKGIIVIGATNRADMLDAALLRPGRFDRKILVNLPDIKSRAEILKLHAQNKKLSSDIDFHQLAQQTPGMSGAQLAAVLNEASILTVRNHKDFITMTELSEALDRVLMGPAKKSIKYDPEERRMVAYHEAGHAVIGIKLKHAQKVQKITIIPRGNAGGYNLMMPEKETFFSSRKRMLAQIQSFLGGRVAEELVFDDISSGAFDDFRQATKIARLMVTKYGMSDLGVSQDSEFSDKKLIDTAIKKIIDTCYQQVQIIIKENKNLLDQIAHLLLEQETITKEEIEQLVVNTKK
uniref:ATP-dependent zinc metalloprotease FtsH n=1 Tax=Apple proliferation phytoplasma TaxID=37692 RepID=G0LXX7_APPPP|nr:HflB protein [Candidatus Phytoplasma mali]